MAVPIEKVKELREKTSVSVALCKQALEEAGGDLTKAVELLRKKGTLIAEKKAGRTAQEGVVESYIHHSGKLGVIVELNCETDFVARRDEFKALAKEIAMQIAATSPRFTSKDDVPQDVIEKEKEIYKELVRKEGKPEKVMEKIVEGKLEKFYQDACLLEQPYFRDDKKKIKDLLSESVAALGENIVIRRFLRYQVGEIKNKNGNT